MRTIVIGGGSSGLIASIHAKTSTNEVIILERNYTCGKKILMTGNGHCNYFHTNITKDNYFSSYTMLENLINKENISKTLKFLDSIGIIPKIKDGYYYPYSNQAISVLNALTEEAKKKGVKIVTNTFVSNIKKENNLFIIETNNGEYQADKLIVSVGGLSYPKSGSDGSLYQILERLGHNIIRPLPALVGLKTKENVKVLKGVRSDALVTHFENGMMVRKEVGEIQHNEDSISGICIMQLSSKIVRGLDKNLEEEIHINYVHDIAKTKEEFLNFLYTQNKLLDGPLIASILDQVLNYKLTNYFLKTLKIPNLPIDKISYEKLLSLSENITNFKLTIIGDNGFSSSQVTSGGVSLSDININTLESKKVNNLYFCGEVLDVSGDCGGYNLAFAFLSGIIAGKSVGDNKK